MRDLVAHEVIENALASSIMDIRPHMRAFKADGIAMELLREDYKLLRKIIYEIEESV